jgi:hypothetical protein
MERVQRIATLAMDGNIIAVHMATNATNDIPIVPAPLPAVVGRSDLRRPHFTAPLRKPET